MSYKDIMKLAKRGASKDVVERLIREKIGYNWDKDTYGEVNIRLHIIGNAMYLREDNSRNWNCVRTSWGCPHHWIRSKSYY